MADRIKPIYRFLNDEILNGDLKNNPKISGIKIDHFKQGESGNTDGYDVSKGKAVAVINAADVRSIYLGRVHMYNEVQGRVTIYAPTKQLGNEVSTLIKGELEVYGFNFSESSQEMLYRDGNPSGVEQTFFEFSTPKFNGIAKYNKK